MNKIEIHIEEIQGCYKSYATILNLQSYLCDPVLILVKISKNYSLSTTSIVIQKFQLRHEI